MTDEPENVTPITALDRETIDALWEELRKSLRPQDVCPLRDCTREHPHGSFGL